MEFCLCGAFQILCDEDYVCSLSPFARSQLMELGRLRAEQSFDGGVDVTPGGDEGLKVGFPVDEAHGTQLLQLLLETHFRSRSLQSEVKSSEHNQIYTAYSVFPTGFGDTAFKMLHILKSAPSIFSV